MIIKYILNLDIINYNKEKLELRNYDIYII